MKTVIFLCLLFFAVHGHAFSHTFDALRPGDSLAGWRQGFSGTKGYPNWKVAKDDSAPSRPQVLQQTGNAIYSWTVYPGLSFKDGEITADMKVQSGKEDPELGLVWRHQDAKNYYYVRINATEDNVVLYRMHNGKKELIKEADTHIGFNTWHNVRVRVLGDQINILLDNKPIVSTRDTVIQKAGLGGLFTTADTIGVFDNFNLQSAD